MAQARSLDLTPRQIEVAELVARRFSHKEIALALGISQGRVSQYVRRLKDRYEVETLGALVEAYRHEAGEENEHPDPFMFSASTDFSLPAEATLLQQDSGNAASRLRFADSQPAWRSLHKGDWQTLSEGGRKSEGERIVPGALDGKHGTFLRLGWMLLVAFGAFVVAVLAMTTGATLSDLLDNAG